MSIPPEILDEIKELLTGLAVQLRQSSTNSDVEHFHYRLENIVHILARFASTGTLQHEEEIFSKLHTALEELDIRNVTAQTGQSFQFITQDQLQYLLEHHFKVREIAHIYSVSVRTIRRRMTQYGLSVRQTYSAISDHELQQKVSDFIANCPNTGYKVVTGYLTSIGHR